MITELQSAISNTPNRRVKLSQLTNVESVKVRVERAALLFRGAPIAISVSAVNALITIAVSWRAIDQGMLMTWAGAILTLAILRISIWLHYRFRKPSARNLANFSRIHIIAMACNGAIWGMLAPIFAINGALDNGFLPFVIAGTTSAAILSAGASWRAVLAFNIPALVPLAVVYAMSGGMTGVAIAGVVTFFGIISAYLAWSTQKMIDRSILLRTKNDRLFKALRKQIDDAHEAEQRFRALVESSQDVTIIFSPEGRVTYASPSAAKVFGGTLSDFIGMTTKELVHPDDIPVFRSVGERTLSKLGEVIELSYVCMRNRGGNYVELGGRLTNMLYVPGVEGFVFNGGTVNKSSRGHPNEAA